MDIIPAYVQEDMMLKPISRTTLTEDIVEQLIALITGGTLKPGDRLPSERELAEQLKVGRTSLREALKSLEIMGLIEVRLGEGTFVRDKSNFFAKPLTLGIKGSVKDALELIETRKLIEVELAGYAAQRATSEQIKKVEQFLQQMEQSLDEPDKFLQADLNFHLAIAEAGQNSLLYHILYMIRNLMRDWIKSALKVPHTNEEALRQHRRIFEALRRREVTKARKAMEAHLSAMGKKLLSVIEGEGAKDHTG